MVGFVSSTASKGVLGYRYPNFYVEVCTDTSGTYVLTRHTSYTHNLHDTYAIYVYNLRARFCMIRFSAQFTCTIYVICFSLARRF